MTYSTSGITQCFRDKNTHRPHRGLAEYTVMVDRCNIPGRSDLLFLKTVIRNFGISALYADIRGRL